jgi:VWFA-related protein
MSNRTNARRSVGAVALAIALLLVGSSRVFDQSAEGPLPSRESENVEVNLVIVDTVALDSHGRPVPDLTIDDFELIIDHRFVPLDTFDVACDLATSEWDDAARVADTEAEPIPPKIVLAFDYLHLKPIERVDAIERMKTMLQREGIDGYRLMLVALTGAVRVEHPFTEDGDAFLASLDRMENDLTLAVPDFFHQNAFGFLRGLTALFDLLGDEPGNKAVVLFSAMEDVPLDKQFERIVATAAAARCAIYPVDVRGLTNVKHIRREGHDVHAEVRERLGLLGIGDQNASDGAGVERVADVSIPSAPMQAAGCG